MGKTAKALKVAFREFRKPKKRGWPKGKKRGPRTPKAEKVSPFKFGNRLSPADSPERGEVERTAKEMAKPDANGWFPGPHKKSRKTKKSKRARMAAQILAKHGIIPPPRADGEWVKRLQDENKALREILGRFLIAGALKLHARDEYITF